MQHHHTLLTVLFFFSFSQRNHISCTNVTQHFLYVYCICSIKQLWDLSWNATEWRESIFWPKTESEEPLTVNVSLFLFSQTVSGVTHELWLHTLALGPAPLTATALIRMQTHCHNSGEAQVNGGANWVRHWVMEQCCRSMNALLKTVLLTASPQWNCIHEPFIPEQCTPHPAPASIAKYHPEKASPPGC